jgi:hypothetical protein
VLPDVDEEGYPYCALMNIYVPWVSLYGYLNGALDGSDIEDDYAIVYHGASHPPTGYWSSSGEHYVGDWAYEQWCYDSLECDYPYYVGYDILVGPIYSYSDTVPIQHLTSATYNVSSFYAPGSLAVSADYGIPIIDFPIYIQ